MIRNRKCQIVEDLLPSYIEGLTGEESNNLVEEHFRTCDICKKRMEKMSDELTIEEINKKELDYLKKYNKKRKRAILLGIIIGIGIVLIYFFICILYRFNILHSLNAKFKKYENINNFNVKVTTTDLSSGNSDILEYWCKKDILKYQINNGELKLMDNYNNKLSSIIGIYYIEDLYSKIKRSSDFFNVQIYENEQVNGTKYYICDWGDEQYIYDKDSGLLQYRWEFLYDKVKLHKYEYKFNSVTEDDILGKYIKGEIYGSYVNSRRQFNCSQTIIQ